MTFWDAGFARQKGWRLAGLLPLVVILAGFEFSHYSGQPFPVPFLLIFAAIVLAAIAGGRVVGIGAALLGSAEIYRCYLLEIGPPSLTGSIGNVLLGALLFFTTAYVLGGLRDLSDRTNDELARHQARLESDLQTEIIEKERSLSDMATHEARLQTAVRIAGLGHFVFNSVTGNCEFCSVQHAAHFGLTPEEFRRDTAGPNPELAYVYPEDRPIVEDAIRRIKFGETVNFEYRAQSKNGDIRHIQEIVEPTFDEHGKIVLESGTSMDLTDLRQTEARLRESQKLEAVGRLTAGVAHDFNNLLAVIMGNLELLEESSDPAESAEMITAALGATRRGASLTSKLLSFGRKAMLSPEPLDLCITIKELGTLFRRTLPSNIAIDLPGIAGECMALLDRAQFESAMLNLVVNAKDAMPDGGRLIIDGAEAHFDAETLRKLGLSLEPGTYIGISVKDTGMGMTRQVMVSALEPFFSTKGVGEGSGLGLPMVLGFAKQSGGDVRIQSDPGKGTTVTLYFKSMKTAKRPTATARADPETARGDGTLVLLVEDDASVRAVTARQLESLGYRVAEAANGDAALDLLRRQPNVDLMLSDVVMPGTLQGPDLVVQARALRPDLPCILMSGYHNPPLGQGNGIPGNVPRLCKPFTRSDLARYLAEVTGRIQPATDP